MLPLIHDLLGGRILSSYACVLQRCNCTLRAEFRQFFRQLCTASVEQSQNSFAEEFGTLDPLNAAVKEHYAELVHRPKSRKRNALFDTSDDRDTFSPKYFKHPPEWYVDKCAKLIKENEIEKAVAMLEVRMLKEDRVYPIKDNFFVVIQACARWGFASKAFELSDLMKRYGFVLNSSLYGALFNACANSPLKKYGLEKTIQLHNSLRHDKTLLSRSTYHALMKAYSRLGRPREVFAIVDEMIEEGLPPDTSTLAHVLQGCIADKEAGFKLAIEVWRKFLKARVYPDTVCFNLLFRACRDCGMGSPEYVSELLKPADSQRVHPLKRRELPFGSSQRHGVRSISAVTTIIPKLTPKSIPDNKEGRDPVWVSIAASLKPDTFPIPENAQPSEHDNTKKIAHFAKPNDEAILISNSAGKPTTPSFRTHILHPNFICPSDLVALGDLSTPTSRFQLLGGVPVLSVLMKQSGAKPDPKTLTMWLNLALNNEKSDEEILKQARSSGVKLDVDFFNQLIVRRAKRSDHKGARDVVDLIREENLTPTLRTFGALVHSCTTESDGLLLLKNMNAVKCKPNIVIFFVLLYRAFQRNNVTYVQNILSELEHRKIPPNELFLKKLHQKVQELKGVLQRQSMDEQFGSRKELKSKFESFEVFYKAWLNRVLMEPEPEHPWKRLAKPIPSEDLREPWEMPWLHQKPKSD